MYLFNCVIMCCMIISLNYEYDITIYIFGHPKWLPVAIFKKTFTRKVVRVIWTMLEPTAGRLQLDIDSPLVNIYNIHVYIQTCMLGTREYTLCSPFRVNAHNSSLHIMIMRFWSRAMPNNGLMYIIYITYLINYISGLYLNRHQRGPLN